MPVRNLSSYLNSFCMETSRALASWFVETLLSTRLIFITEILGQFFNTSFQLIFFTPWKFNSREINVFCMKIPQLTKRHSFIWSQKFQWKKNLFSNFNEITVVDSP